VLSFPVCAMLKSWWVMIIMCWEQFHSTSSDCFGAVRDGDSRQAEWAKHAQLSMDQ
jgi:hypothetical protein